MEAGTIRPSGETASETTAAVPGRSSTARQIHEPVSARPASATPPAERGIPTERGITLSSNWVSETSIRSELPRKVLHMFPGFVPFLLAAVPHPIPLPFMSLVTVAIITVVLTGLYVLMRRAVQRPGESDFWMTTLSYPAVILATVCLFRQAPQLTGVVVIALAWGDGFAYLGGKLLGGRRLPWNNVKSWAGLISFIAVAGPAAVFAYHAELGRNTSWAAALLCGTSAIVAAAIAESLPVRLTDNLRVGVTAAIVAAVTHFAVAAPYLL